MNTKLRSLDDAPAVSTRYAALTLDEWLLLLPQDEIRTLEPVADIREAAKGSDEDNSDVSMVGHIEAGDALVPVYCLNGELQLLDHIPGSRRIVVLLTLGEALIGVLCDEIKSLKHDQLVFHPVPDCMKTPNCILNGLAVHEDRVVGVATSQQLAAYLRV